MKLSNQDIINGIKNSDRKVLLHLYVNLAPKVEKFVKTNNGNIQDAHDIFQNGLIVIFEKLHRDTVKKDFNVKAYIMATCKNLWLLQIRNSKIKIVDKVENLEIEDHSIEDINYSILASKRYELFRKHFDTLGSTCKEIMTLFLKKVSLKDIGEKLGYSEQYAKKKKYKCQKKLVDAIKTDLEYLKLKTSSQQDLLK